MRASIVIAAHNEGAALWKTVQSCVETCRDLNYEIIIADDASEDGSIEELTRRFPRVRIVRHAERQGASPTKDSGARQACGDVLVFLDGHCKPEHGALERLVGGVEQAEGKAIVTPAIPALNAMRWRNSAGQIGHGYSLKLEDLGCGWLPLGKLRGRKLGRRQFYESPALIGCALAMARELYEELQGFDPQMRVWGVEDLDFGLKCWLMEYPILHDPEAVVGHRFRARFDNYSVPYERLVVNQLRMARKQFTQAVWSEWVERCRARHLGRLADHPEGLWARAWHLFEEDRASVEQERAYLHARRVRDEFWYAERFGLKWPRLGACGCGSSSGRVQEGESTSISVMTADPSASPSPPPDDWKVWPGGQPNVNLNPLESFSSADFGFDGLVDWDVGQGPIAAVIDETGTRTAFGLETIHVRYENRSPSAAESDTVWVQASKGEATRTKKRTVFSVFWDTPNTTNNLHPDNQLTFPANTGTAIQRAEFNWEGERGSLVIAAKIETILRFEPSGINWSARGLTFNKSRFRIERLVRAQSLIQRRDLDLNRRIAQNDAGWVYDGSSNPGDTQYPTEGKPNRAFHIDAPGRDVDDLLQLAIRADFIEVAEWNGDKGWQQISDGTTPNANAKWFVNATAVLPNAAKGGENNHGPGNLAATVPNSRPIADAGPDQTVASGATVRLDATGSSDPDNDSGRLRWTQTAGPEVQLSDNTAPQPTFIAPQGPAELRFELKLYDQSQDLHFHNPGTYESLPDTVVITVNAP